MPLFHLNGNSVQTLSREYYNAFTKLQEFVDTFSSIQFHPRDYYPLGDETWDKAKNERDEVRRKINEVYKYVEAHFNYCCDHYGK